MFRKITLLGIYFWVKLIYIGSKVARKNGTSLPGIIVEKYFTSHLKEATDDLREIILVTGTNGKTTSRSLICHIFEETRREAQSNQKNLNMKQNKESLDLENTTFFTNRGGANIMRGLATAIFLNLKIDWTSFSLIARNKIAILEVEEATLPKFCQYVVPTKILFTNIFRDQLDAYGEVDKTLSYFRQSVENIFQSFESSYHERSLDQLRGEMKFETTSFGPFEKSRESVEDYKLVSGFGKNIVNLQKPQKKLEIIVNKDDLKLLTFLLPETEQEKSQTPSVSPENLPDFKENKQFLNTNKLFTEKMYSSFAAKGGAYYQYEPALNTKASSKNLKQGAVNNLENHPEKNSEKNSEIGDDSKKAKSDLGSRLGSSLESSLGSYSSESEAGKKSSTIKIKTKERSGELGVDSRRSQKDFENFKPEPRLKSVSGLTSGFVSDSDLDSRLLSDNSKNTVKYTKKEIEQTSKQSVEKDQKQNDLDWEEQVFSEEDFETPGAVLALENNFAKDTSVASLKLKTQEQPPEKNKRIAQSSGSYFSNSGLDTDQNSKPYFNLDSNLNLNSNRDSILNSDSKSNIKSKKVNKPSSFDNSNFDGFEPTSDSSRDNSINVFDQDSFESGSIVEKNYNPSNSKFGTKKTRARKTKNTTTKTILDESPEGLEIALIGFTLSRSQMKFETVDKYEKKATQEINFSQLIKAENVSFVGGKNRFTVSVDEGEWAVDSPLKGNYNIYNILPSIHLGYTFFGPKIFDYYTSFKPVFGRGESFNLNQSSVEIVLIKNPAGFEEAMLGIDQNYRENDKENFFGEGVLNTKNSKNQSEKLNLVFIINDNIADSQDTSWLWDADLERFREIFQKSQLWTAGTRGLDILLRLKYDGFDLDLEQNFENLSDLVQKIRTKKGDYKILATYTAMLQVREEMSKHTSIQSITENF